MHGGCSSLAEKLPVWRDDSLQQRCEPLLNCFCSNLVYCIQQRNRPFVVELALISLFLEQDNGSLGKELLKVFFPDAPGKALQH